jgi:hypothetical protein
MRKLIPLMLVALPLMLLLAIGCGDDTTTTITEYDTVTVTDTLAVTDTLIEPVPIVAKGSVRLLPLAGLRTSGPKASVVSDEPTGDAYPNFVADLYGAEPIEPYMDSAFIDGSLCDFITQYYWTYGDPYAYVRYSNRADNLRYGSGDTATIEFYAYGEVSTAEVKLLDAVEDMVVLVDAVIPDTVDIGSSLTAVWNDVPNADWYGLQIEYKHGGTGTVVSHYTYDYTYDTTYTIPGAETSYDGYFRVRIVSSTGPVRDAMEGNITGGAVTGTIYSHTESTLSLTYVGTGTPAIPPPAKGLPGVSEEIADDDSGDAWDIIDAITSR